jgi:hypothetical protein
MPASEAVHATPTPAAQPDSQRDARGRFTKNNKGGPGNPFNRRVGQLRTLLIEHVSDDDLAAIVDKVVQMAREGDLAAAKLVLSYTIGKPVPAVDPDRLDVEEFNLFREEAITADTLADPLKGLPAATVCEMVREARPLVEASRREQLAEALRTVEVPQDQDNDPAPEDDATPPTENAGTRNTPEAQPEPSVELPSVLELLDLTFPQRARASTVAPAEPPTDSKPEITADRVANPGLSPSDIPRRQG